MSYEQVGPRQSSLLQDSPLLGVQAFSDRPIDTVFDDSVLDTVKQAWQTIDGDAAADFLVFPERLGAGEDET